MIDWPVVALIAGLLAFLALAGWVARRYSPMQVARRLDRDFARKYGDGI